MNDSITGSAPMFHRPILLIAHRLKDLTPLLGALDMRSRDFH